MLFIFSVLFGCLPFWMANAHNSPFFYSLPINQGFLPDLAQPFIQHHQQAFAPIFNSVPQYYAPPPLIYPSRLPILQNAIDTAPLEKNAIPAPNPFQGFAYRTRLNGDAITRAFFVLGTDAYQPKQFFFNEPVNDNNNKNDDKKTETENPVSRIVENIFNNQGSDFQYIYQPTQSRSNDVTIPLQEPLSNDETEKLDIKQSTTTTEKTTTEAQENETVSEAALKETPTTVALSSTTQTTTTNSPIENTTSSLEITTV